MTLVTLTRDVNGLPRAVTAEDFAPLSWFLEQDIQNDDRACAYIIDECSRISHEGGLLEMSGNAHTIEITRDKVVIRNDYAPLPNSCTVLMGDFIESLKAWRVFSR